MLAISFSFFFWACVAAAVIGALIGFIVIAAYKKQTDEVLAGINNIPKGKTLALFSNEQIQDLREIRKLAYIYSRMDSDSFILYGQRYHVIEVVSRMGQLSNKFKEAGYSERDIADGMARLKDFGYPAEKGF
jgi:hypothetical protein